MSGLASILRRAFGALGTERTRELSAARTPETATAVRVETTNGGIDVEPADGDAVTVSATARTTKSGDGLDNVELDIEEDGETLSVAPVLPEGDHGISVSLDVRVPESLGVSHVETENGGIEVRNVAGDARLVTANGGVEAERVDGALSAETTNGRVELTDCRVTDARSTNGRVVLTLDDVTGDVDARTTNGSVTVRVPDDANARFDLSTDLGSVDTENLTCHVETRSRTRLVGELGDGGPTITGRANTGSVTLTSR